VSSTGMILPPVNVSDVRGTEVADKLKASRHAGAAKIEKSAKEFEAVLLSHWLDQAQQTFATVPGSDSDEDDDPGRDQFNSLAMQSLGAAMSGGRGGLGIASMVAKHLEGTKDAVTPPIAQKTHHLDPVKTSVESTKVPEGKK